MAATFTIGIDLDPLDVDNVEIIQIFATPQVSAGVSRPRASSYRLIFQAQTVDLPDPAAIDILAAYVARFGALISGRKVFLSLRYGVAINDAPFFTHKGNVSESVVRSVIIV